MEGAIMMKIQNYLLAANMLSHATDSATSRTVCKNQTKHDSRECAVALRIRSEMKNAKLEKSTRLAVYKLEQILPNPKYKSKLITKTVAVFNNENESNQLTVTGEMTWIYHHPFDRTARPESRCSRPCGTNAVRVQLLHDSCCWECQVCRDHEYLDDNGTDCTPCPKFRWPDPTTNRTTCVDIQPDAPCFREVRGIVQSSLGASMLVLCVLIFIFFHRHRKHRIIKASSLELSYLMLLAICLGYITIITLSGHPSEILCQVNYLLFCLSFTLIYGPLFLRVLRIYRIFEGSKKSIRPPRFISPKFQLVSSFFLFSVQALMCIVVLAVYSNFSRKTMLDGANKFVELSCMVPLAGLASFLSYNLLLVTACTYLAFKTRQLPENFNESRFITMCITTTMVVWMAFIPGYFLSTSERNKILLLALALCINHTTALLLLFLPKVFAVKYVSSGEGVTWTMMPILRKISRRRVEPINSYRGSPRQTRELPSEPISKAEVHVADPVVLYENDKTRAPTSTYDETKEKTAEPSFHKPIPVLGKPSVVRRTSSTDLVLVNKPSISPGSVTNTDAEGGKADTDVAGPSRRVSFAASFANGPPRNLSLVDSSVDSSDPPKKLSVVETPSNTFLVKPLIIDERSAASETTESRQNVQFIQVQPQPQASSEDVSS